MADNYCFPPLRLDAHQLLSALPKPLFTKPLAIQSVGSLSISPRFISKDFPVFLDEDDKSRVEEQFEDNFPSFENDESVELEYREKPNSFKRTINCWSDFSRFNSKLRDNRKLKHNINQTFFRGLKDTIKHLEVGELYDFSARFVGLTSKTRPYQIAFETFVRGVQPYVTEVYSHFCKRLRYNHPNISFCQKERMRALEIQPALRAYLHYTAFIFYDLDGKRLEEKFKVTYNGTEEIEKVWLGVKTYYAFNMLIEEVCIREVELLQVLREEGLYANFVDSHHLFKSRRSNAK